MYQARYVPVRAEYPRAPAAGPMRAVKLETPEMTRAGQGAGPDESVSARPMQVFSFWGK